MEFLLYFSWSETYQETLKEAVPLNRDTPVPKTDEVTKKLIQSMFHINDKQMRTLQNFPQKRTGKLYFCHTTQDISNGES